ncbi:MAG: Hsp20/alpha crystallin family protein [Sphingobacteriaceae bacterium]|nr:Hsp20/alpha crystallin family protein [Sphingobacteriaceae bacterium]
MTQIKKKDEGVFFPSFVSDFFNSDNFFGNRFFDKDFGRNLPAVNIKEKPTEFNIDFAVPGFNKNDFKIEADNNVLTVSAESKNEKNEENEKFTRKEYSFNSFSRSFTLPQSVNESSIQANYTDGILKLVIPKKEPDKGTGKKTIKVD